MYKVIPKSMKYVDRNLQKEKIYVHLMTKTSTKFKNRYLSKSLFKNHYLFTMFTLFKKYHIETYKKAKKYRE